MEEKWERELELWTENGSELKLEEDRGDANKPKGEKERH